MLCSPRSKKVARQLIGSGILDGCCPDCGRICFKHCCPGRKAESAYAALEAYSQKDSTRGNRQPGKNYALRPQHGSAFQNPLQCFRWGRKLWAPAQRRQWRCSHKAVFQSEILKSLPSLCSLYMRQVPSNRQLPKLRPEPRTNTPLKTRRAACGRSRFLPGLHHR